MSGGRRKEEGWVKAPHFHEVGKVEEDGDGEGVHDNEPSSGQGKEEGWVRVRALEDERERAHRRVAVVTCGEKVREGEGGRNDGARIVLSLHRSHLMRMCGRRVRVRASEG